MRTWDDLTDAERAAVLRRYLGVTRVQLLEELWNYEQIVEYYADTATE